MLAMCSSIHNPRITIHATTCGSLSAEITETTKKEPKLDARSLPSVFPWIESVQNRQPSRWDRRDRRQSRDGKRRTSWVVSEFEFGNRHRKFVASCSKTRTTSSEPAPKAARWADRMPEEPQSDLRKVSDLRRFSSVKKLAGSPLPVQKQQ